MADILGRIFAFFRDDFFPNLSYYLLQVFLLVLLVILFAGVNLLVRFLTDPVCINVLRMREEKRGPGLVGLFFSTIIMVFALVFAFSHFPQLRPTAVGWVGEKLQHVIVWDKLPNLQKPGAAGPAKSVWPPAEKGAADAAANPPPSSPPFPPPSGKGKPPPAP